MITGAAFCPTPPVLLPAVARGAAAELEPLRVACRVAIRRVAAPGSRVLLLGAGERWQRHDPSARGTLAGLGVDLTVPLDRSAAGPVELPLSLTVGAWLLHESVDGPVEVEAWSVGAGPSALEPPDGPTALLVLGDGSARRTLAAPGYLDDRAAGFDAQVAAALAGGVPDALRVDLALGDDLLAAGPRAWHAAADLLAGRTWSAEVLYDDAPYGVGYFAAAWTAA